MKHLGWIGSGILIIILGISGKFVFVGTNSPQMLILFGEALIIIGYVQLIRSKGGLNTVPTRKKRIGWRIALVIVLGFLTFIGLFMITGFSVATMVRGEDIRGEVIEGIIAGSIMSLLLAPAIIILKKAKHENKILEIQRNKSAETNKG